MEKNSYFFHLEKKNFCCSTSIFCIDQLNPMSSRFASIVFNVQTRLVSGQPY